MPPVPFSAASGVASDTREAQNGMAHSSTAMSDARRSKRLPFSRARCVLNPYHAMDGEKVEPFARLEVFVERARRLVAADLNGRSDPYVVLSMDDSDPLAQTKCVKSTLAPVWNEKFVLDVFHPHSILWLKVFDWDVKVLSSVTGMEDAFLGSVDVHLARLPFNEEVVGWWDVSHPEAESKKHEDHPDAPPRDDYAGSVRIGLLLKCPNPRDEFYASCLHPPKVATNFFGKVDMGELFRKTVKIAMAAQACFEGFQTSWQRIVDSPFGVFRHILLWFLGVVVVWNPSWALPTLLYTLGAAMWFAIALSAAHTVEERSHSRKPPPPRVKNKYLKALKAPLIHTKQREEPEPADVLEQGTAVAQVHGKAAMSDKMVDDIANKLTQYGDKGLSYMLQEDEQEQVMSQLQQVNSTIGDLTDVLGTVQAVLRHPVLKPLVLIAFAALIVLPIYYQETRLLLLPNRLLQLGLTWTMTVLLWENSPPARLLVGCRCYSQSLRIKSFESNTEVIVKQGSNLVADRALDIEAGTADIAASSASGAGQSARHTPTNLSKHCVQLLRGDSIKLSSSQVGVALAAISQAYSHHLKHHTYFQPTWCADCGRLLVGLANQGLRCTACHINLCEDCGNLPMDDCPGAGAVAEASTRTDVAEKSPKNGNGSSSAQAAAAVVNQELLRSTAGHSTPFLSSCYRVAAEVKDDAD